MMVLDGTMELQEWLHAAGPTFISSNIPQGCRLTAILAGKQPMSETTTAPRVRLAPRVERPRLFKVLLHNDDFTPREFVVLVLKAEFRMDEAQASRVMMTAHRRGVCVVAVLTQEVAEAKATTATDMARQKGYPLLFTTEPED